MNTVVIVGLAVSYGLAFAVLAVAVMSDKAHKRDRHNRKID